MAKKKPPLGPQPNAKAKKSRGGRVRSTGRGVRPKRFDKKSHQGRKGSDERPAGGTIAGQGVTAGVGEGTPWPGVKIIPKGEARMGREGRPGV